MMKNESLYNKHNNFAESTLKRLTKAELVDYCLLLQKNLVITQNGHEQHVRNIENLIAKGVLSWTDKLATNSDVK